jgi:hypothetical protein
VDIRDVSVRVGNIPRSLVIKAEVDERIMQIINSLNNSKKNGERMHGQESEKKIGRKKDQNGTSRQLRKEKDVPTLGFVSGEFRLRWGPLEGALAASDLERLVNLVVQDQREGAPSTVSGRVCLRLGIHSVHQEPPAEGGFWSGIVLAYEGAKAFAQKKIPRMPVSAAVDLVPMENDIPMQVAQK